MEEKRLTGKVDWFNEKKGFGLIIRNGEEFFVHYSEIKSNVEGFKVLKKDEEVLFGVGNDPKGKVCAINVTAVDGKKLRFEKKYK
jgi:cold shock protein